MGFEGGPWENNWLKREGGGGGVGRKNWIQWIKTE